MNISNNKIDLKSQSNLYTLTRVKFHSFDSELLHIAYSNLADSIKNLGGKITGLIRLPTSKHYYCVLNSPHVYKKSREHFEVSEYRGLFDIYIPKDRVAISDSFLKIAIPSGVLVDIVS